MIGVVTQPIEGNSSSVCSLLNISLIVLELACWFGLYSLLGSRQMRLRMTTKAKQATVSLSTMRMRSLLLVGTGDST